MAAAVVLLLLLAPEMREPIGRGKWQSQPDPVGRRVASLLAGSPARGAFVTVVPLFARVPSEAGHGRQDGPGWRDGRLRGRKVADGQGTYLRVTNPARRAQLITAGSVFARGADAFYVTRDAVVSPEFAALLPAAAQPQDAKGQGMRLVEGVLPPLATGILLHGKIRFAQAVTDRWRKLHGTAAYVQVLQSAAVRRLAIQLERLCQPFCGEGADGTAVGAVFLIAGAPVGAHLYSSHALFVATLPDVLKGVAVQAVDVARRGLSQRDLRRLSRLSRPRALAAGFLRSMLPVRGEWSESYGEGFEVVMRNERKGAMGHAVLDRRRTVVHAAFYGLGDSWPGGRRAARGGPVPRPDTGGSELPPRLRKKRKVPQPPKVVQPPPAPRPPPRAGDGERPKGG